MTQLQRFQPPVNPGITSRAVVALMALTLALASCGGGNTPAAEASGAASAQPRTTTTPATEPDAALAQGARLNAASLVAAEKAAAGATDTPTDALQPGQIAPKSAYRSGDIARKAAAVKVAVYRFFNSQTGAHFFTRSTDERNNVVATQSPPFSLEGEAFSVASDFSPGLSPVHRFYNTQNGVHLYTISETERSNVVANLPQFYYEGVAYYASEVAGTGFKPFYRFYVPSKGFHFYTANEAEKDNIVAKLSVTYTFEGVGYYVLDSDWRAEKLPHTGITSLQCYKAGSDALVTCTPPVAQEILGGTSVNLNPQQDGHTPRKSVNPMSYSAVGSFPKESCVKDDVTGLIWEGKTTSGLRSWAHIYSNVGSNAADDASGYVAAVNSAQLCGFTDWRLPTVLELQGLVDYSKATYPRINTTWFPNALVPNYWTAPVNPLVSFGYVVSFGDASDVGGWSYPGPSSTMLAVRLVRGVNALQGPRFSYSSASYPGDAANNLVNDALTGLQWRRCVEGMQWDGTACVGANLTAVHEAALVRAASQTGWRLPNVKELNSLMERATPSAQPGIDATAFPQAPAEGLWSSTPQVGASNSAWGVFMVNGYVLSNLRATPRAMRLVRTNP